MSYRLLSLAVVLIASPVFADEVKTLGGKNYTGTVTSLDKDEVTITVNGKEEKVRLAQVLAVEMRAVKGLAADAKFAEIRLLDETVINCKDVAFEGKNVKVTMMSGAEFSVPLDSVVSYLKDAGNKRTRKQWDEFGGKGSGLRRDLVFLLSKEGDLNPLKGTLGDVDDKEKTIDFKVEALKDVLKKFPLQNIHGMVFYRNEAPKFIPVGKVIDVDGNILAATGLSYDGKTLTLTTGFGAKIPLGNLAVSKLDFNLGKLTFLSDMQPASVVEKSGIGLITRFQRDANLDGEPILLEKQYGKGLSIHSHTELEYNLDGKFKDFKAVLGVDTRTGADSKALVSIYVDGQKSFSEVVSAKATQPINLNVQGAKTLRIVVSSQNFLDLHDHATLAEARVSQ